jgi:hypothetical protein
MPVWSANSEPQTASRDASSNDSVFLEQLPLPRVLRHFAAGDEYALGACRQLERIAGPHDHVGILADLE